MKITIITPCCRSENLPTLFESIDFNHVEKWIIVYDTSRERSYTWQFVNNPQIIETDCNVEGTAGHPQRNYGLNYVTSGSVYFLDDDNIIHPDFWKVIPTLDEYYMYSWQQIFNDGNINSCNPPTANGIDTAMYIIPNSLIQNIRFNKHFNWSDGLFITSIYHENKDKYIYIPQILCYYNKLRQ